VLFSNLYERDSDSERVLEIYEVIFWLRVNQSLGWIDEKQNEITSTTYLVDHQ
jgi:hypothetical protein